MARLKDIYYNEIVPGMKRNLDTRSVMEVPKLEKIVINMGVGDAKENAKSIRCSS